MKDTTRERSVLIIDDDDDLRVTLGDVMSAACHAECLTLPDVESMIRAADQVLGCLLAVIDINLGPGQPSGLDAQLWLKNHGFEGCIILLTGHAATHPLVQEAMANGAARIMQKPIDPRKLCALLEELSS
jgi:FixJ family two-component response regulator